MKASVAQFKSSSEACKSPSTVVKLPRRTKGRPTLTVLSKRAWTTFDPAIKKWIYGNELIRINK